MGKNNSKKERFGMKVRQPITYAPVPKRKKGISNALKAIIAIALIVVISVGVATSLSGQPSQPSQQTGTETKSYPTSVSPVFYSNPTLSSDGNKVTIPTSNVNASKLVFVDLKLKTTTETLPYQGRTVPLAYYKNGQYLPLVIISTPSGNTVAGIRTCEPCGSFSFHIVKGTNLKCDVCGAEWRLEDFAPSSGGCATYPPPKLPTTVNGDSVTVDLSALQLQYA